MAAAPKLASLDEEAAAKRKAPEKPPRKTSKAPAKTPAKTSKTATKASKTPATSKKASKTPATSKKASKTQASSKKASKTPALKTPGASTTRKTKRASPDMNGIVSDVHVVLQRLEKTPYAHKLDAQDVFNRLEQCARSPKRVEIVCEEIRVESETEEDESAETPPEVVKRRTPAVVSSKRLTRSVRKTLPKKNSPAVQTSKVVKRFSPAQRPTKPKTSLKKSSTALPPSVFYGTPKSMDPSAVLKRKLKIHVDEQVKDRMAKLPTSSPYALLEGETENGSPTVAFTKVKKATPSSAKKTQYMTATPGLAAHSGRGRRVLGSMNRQTPKPNLNPTKMALKFDDDEDDEVTIAMTCPSSPVVDMDDEEDEENVAVVTASPVKQQPQLVTGDLGNACLIM